MIAIDPRDSNVVYVAAQGPLWRAGGDRGLYKTTDGGKTWDGAAHQRGHRRQRGPPRSARSRHAVRRRLPAAPARLDADQRRAGVGNLQVDRRGQDLAQGDRGLPEVDLGRIGLAISPAGSGRGVRHGRSGRGRGRLFRSTDRGETWEQAQRLHDRQPAVLQRARRRPARRRPRLLDGHVLHVSDDGGKTFTRGRREVKHVDNHALWIDPDEPRPPAHRLRRRPLRVLRSRRDLATSSPTCRSPSSTGSRVDNDAVLLVYGGTQDNNTLGGPSRTRDQSGIANEDWFVTVGGDGFEPGRPRGPEHRLHPVAVRRPGALRPRTGEPVDIRPREAPGEAPPLELGHAADHQPAPHTRLYFASQRLFRSDDRGDSWHADLRRSHPADRSRPAAGDGQGLGRGRGRQERVHLLLRQHRRRSPSRRSSRGCSTSAPTTA